MKGNAMRFSLFLASTFVACVASMPSLAAASDSPAILFEVGAKLGIAEHAAQSGGKASEIVRQLREAKQLSANADFVSAAEFDRLIDHATGEATETPLADQIKAFRKQLTARLTKGEFGHCNPDAWLGKWETNWGDMVLQRTDDGRIEGYYGSSKHMVEGQVDPDTPCVFEGIWRHRGSDSTGRFRFVIDRPGSFAGAWTSGRADPAKTTINWTGMRVVMAELPDVPAEGSEEGEGVATE